MQHHSLKLLEIISYLNTESLYPYPNPFLSLFFLVPSLGHPSPPGTAARPRDI